MELGFTGANQAHAVFTTRDQQGLQLQFVNHGLGFFQQILLAGNATDNGLKFVQIGG